MVEIVGTSDGTMASCTSKENIDRGKMNVLVVPTIRESVVEFLNSWDSIEPWDSIIIVEDNPEKTIFTDCKHHYSWKEIDEDLGDDSWIISRRDSAIRSYGFLKAYQMGAEQIFTLDDDCFPIEPGNYIRKHLKNLYETPRWTQTAGCRTRGIPYDNLGTLPNVVISVGLWEGVPDFDSVQMLSNDVREFTPPSGTRIIPKDQYFPLCGMNFAFQKKATPLCFFPLMGEGRPYRRFDDIWFGIIAKKICDHLGWHISVGEPHIHHSKASNKFKNLEREAPGIVANESFWNLIDNYGNQLSSNKAEGCMFEIGTMMSESESKYIQELGRAIVVWSGLFDA